MISIVSAYINRKCLLYKTLKSITQSKYKDFEFILVDDGSTENERIEDFLIEFPFLKIIRLDPKDRWYINPCVPFNIGIKAAKGDIIILQSPECFHVHDILTYVSKNINNSNYISMSAYGLTEDFTKELHTLTLTTEIQQFFKNLPQVSAAKGYTNCWLNHSEYMPFHYHYCSAITKKNMNKLGGFDERWAYGIGGDDDEFAYRVDKLKLLRVIEDNLSVIHQYHHRVCHDYSNFNELNLKNRNLLNKLKGVK